MQETKHPLKSTTIIGLIVTTIALVLQLFGIDFGAEEQAQLILAGTQVVGLLVALFGRWKATVPLSLKIIAPVAMALLLGGCATMTPSQRYAVTSNAFSATVDEVAHLVQVGAIQDDKLGDIQATAHAINDELDALDAALRNNTPLDFPFVLARVERLLGRLAQYQLDAEGVTHGPGTSDRDSSGRHPAVFADQRTRAQGARAEARADFERARRGGTQAQAGHEQPGQRDQVASGLRYLAWRWNRLTVATI